MDFFKKIKNSAIFIKVKNILNSYFLDSKTSNLENFEDQKLEESQNPEEGAVEITPLDKNKESVIQPSQDEDPSIDISPNHPEIESPTSDFETPIQGFLIESEKLKLFRTGTINRTRSEIEDFNSLHENFKNNFLFKISELTRISSTPSFSNFLNRSSPTKTQSKSIIQILAINSLQDLSKQRIKKEEEFEQFIKKEFNKDRNQIYLHVSKEEFDKARKVYFKLSVKIKKANSKIKKQFEAILPKIEEAEKQFFKKEQDRKLKEELERKRKEEERLEAIRLEEERARKVEEDRITEEKKKELINKAILENAKRLQDLEYEKRKLADEKFRKEEELRIAKIFEEENKKKEEEELRNKILEEQNRINPNIPLPIRKKVQDDADSAKENTNIYGSGVISNTEHLKSLLNRKEDWKEFEEILDQNNIEYLYHFTDTRNIPSIKKQGGLFSWHYCDVNRINIPFPGGGTGSRYNDSKNGKVDYVRLAFNKNHPMLYIAKDDGRIDNHIWLKINREVTFFEYTEFSDKNAAAFKSYVPNIGKEIKYLKNIRFDILRKGERIKHYMLSSEEKQYNQAEILVKTWIPISFIENINELK